MIDYMAIHRAYVEADAHLGRKEAAARTPAMQGRWAQARAYNDQAYFVMRFAQLEQHVGRESRRLVDRKRALVKWRQRRPWDRVRLDRVSLMDKVAMLTQAGNAAYNRIDQLYDMRCEIAHGNTATVGPIFIPTVANEKRTLASQMRG
jgi:hypothetical protein